MYIIAFLLPTMIYAQFAVYTMTGDVPNNLLIFSGNPADGTLTYDSEVSTGGDGDSSTGLQSQHSVIVHNNNIFCVNAGSDTVSMFSIGSSPTAVTLVTTAATGGNWPNSLTAYGNNLCVINAGEANSIRCFTITSSGLTTLFDFPLYYNLTTPPVSHVGPAQLSFLPDGTALVMSIKGINPPVQLFPFSVTLGISPAVNASNHGMVSFGFDFMPDRTIILTDAAPTGAGGGVIAITPSLTSLTFDDTYFLIPGQNAACWAIISPISSNIYVTNAGSGSISVLSYSSYYMTFTSLNTTTFSFGGLTDTTIVNVNGAEYLYVLSGSHQTVSAMALVKNAATTFQTATFGVTAGHAIGLASYVVPPTPAPSPNPAPNPGPYPAPYHSSSSRLYFVVLWFSFGLFTLLML